MNFNNKKQKDDEKMLDIKRLNTAQKVIIKELEKQEIVYENQIVGLVKENNRLKSTANSVADSFYLELMNKLQLKEKGSINVDIKQSNLNDGDLDKLLKRLKNDLRVDSYSYNEEKKTLRVQLNPLLIQSREKNENYTFKRQEDPKIEEDDEEEDEI